MITQKTYTIKGHYIDGVLGKRLDETRVTAINDLPGVVVFTPKGPFYSELFIGDETTPIPREQLHESLQGLVELTTKEHERKSSDRAFAIRKAL